MCFLHLQDTDERREGRRRREEEAKCNLRYVRQNGSRRAERREGGR